MFDSEIVKLFIFEQIVTANFKETEVSFSLMESMTCLERYIWAWKNARWKNMPFIITRTAFLKTLFQSSSSAQTDGAKASTQTRGNQSFNAKHESNIWVQVGPENGLQLAHSTPVVSAGASCPIPQWMCCCLYFCYDAWGRILFISCWWNSLFFFLLVNFSWLILPSLSLSDEGKRKMLVCPCLIPTTKELVVAVHLR